MKIVKILSACAASILLLMGSGALAAGDVAKGKKVANKCKACHTMNEGGKNKLGPNLYGILGKTAGKVPGYKYSKAMKSSSVVWDESNCRDFVKKRKSVIKGTKMSFRGIKKAAQRADLVAYFQTLGGAGQQQITAGSVEDGMIVAEKHCVVCHTFERGGKTVFGPNLFDMAGKPAGMIKGYRYSKALKDSGLVWTDNNLVGFLADPEQFLKGTTARFPGLKTAKEKADILAYMKSLK